VANLLDHETKSQVLLNIQATSGDPPSYGHTQVIFVDDLNIKFRGFRDNFAFFFALKLEPNNLCAMSFVQKIKIKAKKPTRTSKTDGIIVSPSIHSYAFLNTNFSVSFFCLVYLFVPR
jgi:hypothetical protein